MTLNAKYIATRIAIVIKGLKTHCGALIAFKINPIATPATSMIIRIRAN